MSYNIKKSFFHSLIALILCLSMLVGTTYAWFTDSEISANNIIQAGNLDIAMYWNEDLTGSWKDIKDENKLFDYDKWEPGYTEVRYVKIVNEGNLAFRYAMSVLPLGEVGILANVIDVYYVENPTAPIGDRTQLTAPVGTLAQVIAGEFVTSGKMENKGDELIVGIALKMREDAGNEYQGKSVGDAFSIQIVATQLAHENDSFDNTYDENATFPDAPVNEGVTAPVENENGLAKNNVSLNGTNASATVPAGTKLEDGASQLTLTVTELNESGANIALGENEEKKSLDVHIDGVAATNDKPIIISLGAIAPIGQNSGNFKLYHVENGQSNEMTGVESVAELVAHNQFYYDPATGEVTVAMATFSEVALVADTENAWNGNFDYSWYYASEKTLTIANADQLAAFGAIVGGMDGQVQDSFKGKTVKLIADINIADTDSENGLVFYPIGYYNNTGSYEKKAGNVGPDGSAVSSGFETFEGTFDGNGHTIKNFYQNTWEMFGDYNDGYSGTPNHYRDGMGLFGKVYGGTVKNLTINNFSSDGEFGTTGCVAAYADCGATFENIALFNCNPRVYNIGNGGIVGCVGWYAKDTVNTPVTFRNITVDNTNKISALWGSWDVACGGIVGQYYPTSGQSSANYPKNAGIHFENCHIAAQIDVYNDVCANYQYYAYRYAGILLGSVRENVTIDGHEYPKMDGITASDCTVHFGDWNDYYYCELVANSLASYTHDHQMSRLEQVSEVDGKVVTYLDGTTETITGTRSFVVVKAKDANGKWIHGDGEEYAECYHFVNGEVWNHEDAGMETVDGVEVLKEDKQHIYREFNNLVTGYGWGVTSKGVGEMDGVTILDREEANSVDKFVAKEGYENILFADGEVIRVGDLFEATDISDSKLSIVGENVQVTVSPAKNDPTSTVGATFVLDENNWEDSQLTFSGSGDAEITITDYYFCNSTTITLKSWKAMPIWGGNGAFAESVTYEVDFKFNDGLSSLVFVFNQQSEDGDRLLDYFAVDVSPKSDNEIQVTPSFRPNLNNDKFTQGTPAVVSYNVNDGKVKENSHKLKIETFENNGVVYADIYIDNILACDDYNMTEAASGKLAEVALKSNFGVRQGADRSCKIDAIKVTSGETVIYENGFDLSGSPFNGVEIKDGYLDIANASRHIYHIEKRFIHEVLVNIESGGLQYMFNRQNDGRYYTLQFDVTPAEGSAVQNNVRIVKWEPDNATGDFNYGHARIDGIVANENENYNLRLVTYNDVAEVYLKKAGEEYYNLILTAKLDSEDTQNSVFGVRQGGGATAYLDNLSVVTYESLKDCGYVQEVYKSDFSDGVSPIDNNHISVDEGRLKVGASAIGYADMGADSVVFRKEISLASDKTVRKVTVSAVAIGTVDLYINGSKVGTIAAEDELYSTFDITNSINSGENCVGAVCSNVADRRFALQMTVYYTDGTEDTFVSDDTWSAFSGTDNLPDDWNSVEFDETWAKPILRTQFKHLSPSANNVQ